MLKRSVIAAVVLTAGVMGMAACGNNESPAPTANSETIAAQTSYPTGPIGSEFKIWDDASTTKTVTVDNPLRFFDPATGTNWQVQAVVSQKQGTSYVGRFEALLDNGTKIDQEPASSGTPALKDWGQIVPGEVRKGVVAFTVPAGAQVSKIFYNQEGETAAEWDL